MEELWLRPLPWVFLHLPLAVLVVLCALCLAKLPSGRRRGLLPVTATLAACGAVLFGGAWLLGRFDLEWRMIPKAVLGLAVWVLGLASGILTARYIGRWIAGHRPKLALWGQALALYCLISVMGVGSIVGGLWALIPDEQVGTWQGQTVVQCAWTFMGSSYAVHEYYGPLVRGADALAWSEEPMTEESGQRAMEQGVKSAGRELGVSLTDGTPLYYQDDHGGLQGDGNTFLTVSFEEPPEWLADWEPLTGAEDLIRRANRRLGEDYFPEPGQGRYFFADRSPDGSPSLWNFTLAVYDSSRDTLYYLKFDI